MNNLLMEVENEVAVVTINRPKSLNALNSETLAELDQCFGEIAERKDIRVVILTGSGTKLLLQAQIFLRWSMQHLLKEERWVFLLKKLS